MGKAMGRLPEAISRLCPNVRRSLGRLVVLVPM